jgi:hypothetical protein|nr:MAG TPA: hypothetical protein [Caudoviricetes sp.]
MNTNMLYELYRITEKNDAPDLATIGMAMLRNEHPEITHDEDMAMRHFIGLHGKKLAEAYPDRVAFEAAVEAGMISDRKTAHH